MFLIFFGHDSLKNNLNWFTYTWIAVCNRLLTWSTYWQTDILLDMVIWLRFSRYFSVPLGKSQVGTSATPPPFFFVSNPFQFDFHQSSYHWIHYSLRNWERPKISQNSVKFLFIYVAT
jgi:hypothetical protein